MLPESDNNYSVSRKEIKRQFTQRYLAEVGQKKCAPYSGFGVRHAPVKVCALLRFNCAPCSGFCNADWGRASEYWGESKFGE
jgi:hypothetical protein